MATGDSSDIFSRLRSVLPDRWFPSASDGSTSPTPVLDAILSGIADTLSWAYSLFGYVRNQTRLSTSTDGWLEIAALDYFGPSGFPRYPGETDPSYAARIQAALLPKANTRTNIENALVAYTGSPVRIIEPWDPRDTFVWGGPHSFWGVNTKSNPGQWANGGDRYRGLVVCMLPGALGSGSTRFGWGNGFWGNMSVLGVLGMSWTAGTTASLAAAQVYALINRLRMVGVTIFVRFTSDPSELSDAQALSAPSLDFSVPADSQSLPGVNL